MHKLIKIIGAGLVVTALSAATHPTSLLERAGNILGKIRVLTADQIVTDEVVRAAIRDNSWKNLRGASWAAREAVFMANQCQIFSTGFDKSVEDMCLSAGMALYYEGTSDGVGVEKRTGIPAFLLTEFFPEARKIIYGTMRAHLASSANVKAAYDAKQHIVMEEFERLSAEDRATFQLLLAASIEEFERFRDDDTIRVQYISYLSLEKDWLASPTGGNSSAFRAMNDAGHALKKVIGSFDIYQFAARRHAEGGDELIATYIALMKDFQSKLPA